MKKITILLLGLFLVSNLYSADRRAVRSNWPCMDAQLNCIGYENGKVSFTVIFRFRPMEYTNQQLPDLQLKYSINNGQPRYEEISKDNINSMTRASLKTIGYHNGVMVKDYVNDIRIDVVVPVSQFSTSFDYSIELADENGAPYPIASFPNLMAMFDAEKNPSYPDYSIDEADQIQEAMTKDVCQNLNCSAETLLNGFRLNVNDLETELTITPNPINDRVTINYQSETETTSTIEIVDIQGKTVRQIVRSNQNSPAISNQFKIGRSINLYT